MAARSIGAAAGLALLALTAGCANSSAPAAGNSGRLVVHVAVYGGPELPNGQMAVSGAPSTGQAVQVQDGSGHSWSATTNRRGDAIFHLAAGRYRIRSGCGIPRTVTVAAGRDARAAIRCDVP